MLQILNYSTKFLASVEVHSKVGRDNSTENVRAKLLMSHLGCRFFPFWGQNSIPLVAIFGSQI